VPAAPQGSACNTFDFDFDSGQAEKTLCRREIKKNQWKTRCAQEAEATSQPHLC